MSARRPSLRWEWTLANGARVAAELDTEANHEIVFVGARSVAEVERGSRPEGHAVTAPAPPGGRSDEAIAAVIAFEPKAPICILRVDGHEVAPSKWPVPQKREVPVSAGPRPRGMLLLAVVAVPLVAGLAFFAWPSSAPKKEELATSYRAENGLFIAHHPVTFTSKVAILPAPLAGVLLEDAAARETIILAAAPLDEGIAVDGWVLQQRFHDEVLADLPKTARTYAESDRREDRCLNEPGAVINGRFDRPDGSHVRVWTCAFVKEGRGYFVAYVLPEASKDARLRRIVDGTELTQLTPR